MPRIPYTPQEFPSGVDPRYLKRRTEVFSWAELVHAAVTVGRRNWSDVLQYGNYSVLETLWRIAMLRANVRVGTRRRLVASAAYRGLDRSEKGAVSFHMGLCLAKAFALRLFGVPWLLHLSVYQRVLNPTFVTSERPDFVGFDRSGRTVVIEAKGRTGNAPTQLIVTAKEQARAISTVSGAAPVFRLAMVSCFGAQGLRLLVRDPADAHHDAVSISEPIAALATAYYTPVFDLARSLGPLSGTGTSEDWVVVLPGMDASLCIAKEVVGWYANGQPTWEEIMKRHADLVSGLQERETRAQVEKRFARESLRPLPGHAHQDAEEEENFAFDGPDGIAIRLGRSWSQEFMEREPEQRQ